MFSVSRDDHTEALKLIDSVYDKSEDRQIILEKLKL